MNLPKVRRLSKELDFSWYRAFGERWRIKEVRTEIVNCETCDDPASQVTIQILVSGDAIRRMMTPSLRSKDVAAFICAGARNAALT